MFLREAISAHLPDDKLLHHVKKPEVDKIVLSSRPDDELVALRPWIFMTFDPGISSREWHKAANGSQARRGRFHGQEG